MTLIKYSHVEQLFIRDLIKLFINKLFEIDFETNVSDKSFIEEQRFEVIIASLSSSNNKYR